LANHRSYYHIADFRPFLKHPEKYVNVGNKPLVARSGLEMKCFSKIDQLTSVVKWSSENVVIPYQKPIFLNETDSSVIGTDQHKYYIDLWVCWKSETGGVVEMLVEIKPKSMCHPPKIPVNGNKKSWLNYHSSNRQYLINKYKWVESVNLCRKMTASGNRSISFVIMTEEEILSGEKICGM